MSRHEEPQTDETLGGRHAHEPDARLGDLASTAKLRLLALSHSTEPDAQGHLESIWQLAVREIPEFHHVEVRSDTSDRFSGGGIYCPGDEDDTLHFKYTALNREMLLELMEHRPRSTELVAQQLGIAREELTPEILRVFIFLHEAGHALDYLKNFLAPRIAQGSQTPKKEATEEWEQRFFAELRSLPVPNTDPSTLRAFSGFAPMDEFIAQHGASPDLIAHAKSNPEGVIRLQEEAYKNGESERRADEFAATFMRKHNLHREQTGGERTSQ